MNTLKNRRKWTYALYGVLIAVIGYATTALASSPEPEADCSECEAKWLAIATEWCSLRDGVWTYYCDGTEFTAWCFFGPAFGPVPCDI